ncbi:hypothetical protein AB0O01_04530 [Streptomyces sp. NPDC093252]|uniref:hypothetical protein n=1 Tax=Streptomyces sp. NPDC093252 TaxID=3154980 RepID=UPI00341B6773
MEQVRAVLVAVGAAAGVALVAGCGGDGDAVRPRPAGSGAPRVSAAPEAGVMAPARVEVIAALAGCAAEIRIEADELRQGVCESGGDGYVITTFPEDRLKETWLDSAGVYGGTYLVGARWVVGAEPGLLTGLRERLGGEVRELRGIGPTAGR